MSHGVFVEFNKTCDHRSDCNKLATCVCIVVDPLEGVLFIHCCEDHRDNAFRKLLELFRDEAIVTINTNDAKALEEIGEEIGVDVVVHDPPGIPRVPKDLN